MKNMKSVDISEINLLPVRPRNGLISFASCLFDGKLSLNSIAIYTRPKGGYRLVYPAKTLPNGKLINLFYPIDRETGEIIHEAIIGKFEELVEKVEVKNEGFNTD